MTVTENDNCSLMVGDLLVEPALDRISRNTRTINLRPQVMELLVFLASNSGQVVSVEELLDKLWSGKVVTDGALYNCIGELRHAISSLDDTQSYIENIPKKGYRLSAPIKKLPKPLITPEAKGSWVRWANSGTRPRRRSILAWALPLVVFLGIKRTGDGQNESRLTVSNKFKLALVGGLFVALAVIFYPLWPRDDRSIAVLPFEDISPGGDQAYFGSSIADELRLKLQRLDGLRVAGRTSSIASAQEESKTIGEILNVDSILEGSISKDGNNVRVTVQLTHVADGFTIWSESYNRKLENIFEIQEEIATSVAGSLGVRLGVGAINAFRGAGTRNVEAYQAFLQAQSKDWTASGTKEANRLLERAIELDPNYAAAWSLLGARTLSMTWDVNPDHTLEIVDRAYPLALRGVQLNPESAVAQTVLAQVRHSQLDWIGAEQGLTRAIALLADRNSFGMYANVLARGGRTAYAQRQYGIAKTLAPMNGRPTGLAWHASLAQGRFAEAQEISNWQQGIDRIENNLDIAFNKGDPEALKAAIQAMPKMNLAYIGLYATVLAEFDSPERILSILRDVYLDENLQWTRKLHDIAMVAAYFEEPRFALKVKGEEVRTSPTRLAAVWYPVMSEVRQLPEFKKLVTELNLVEYWRTYGWADACRPLANDEFECF